MGNQNKPETKAQKNARHLDADLSLTDREDALELVGKLEKLDDQDRNKK